MNPTNTGFQFEIVGNAVNDSLKSPIAVHGSHYGLIKANVVFGGSQLTGAGIAVEDGSETENLFEENFVANIRGDVNPRESGPDTADGTTPGSAAECFWTNGFNNRFVSNVAASCRNPPADRLRPGLQVHRGTRALYREVPLVRGADMTGRPDHAGHAPVSADPRVPRQRGVRSCRGWSHGVAARDGWRRQPAGIAESLIKDFRVWHTYEGAIYNYPAHRMTVDGLVYRIDPGATVYWPSAFQCGDYRNFDITIRGGSIHAGDVFSGCTDPLGVYRFENIRAVTRFHAFEFTTPATPGTGADRPASGVTMILRNNVVQAWPGQPLRTIGMDHDTSKPNTQAADKYEVLVYDYQGEAGNNFRAYYHQQATQNIAGGLAPCSDSTSRPEIDGITCPLSGPPPPPTQPPAAPTNLQVL